MRNNIPKSVLIAVSCLLIFFATAHFSFATTYTITDIGTLGGDNWNVARDINNHGQVVGESYIQYNGPNHPFIWENGIMRDLGGGIGYASGINNLGQVVGTLSGRATLWDHGIITDLGTLGGFYSFATHINDSGQIVGHIQTPSGKAEAFFWENGNVTNLGNLTGGLWSYAEGINNRGQVVVRAWMGSSYHAFLWEEGTMTDLGEFDPYSINDGGQIVGTMNYNPILWENGIITNLGNLGGQYDNIALDINNRGQVVGHCKTQSGWSHAFIWEDGVMTDLGTIGPYNSYAYAINDLGQIVGRSNNQLGDRAVLWEPTPLSQPISIDIKPGSYPNCFNVNSHGVIPVAILGRADFDVTRIDVSTLDFAGLKIRVKGNGALQCSVEDVSGDYTYPEGAPDGYLDLVCQFVKDSTAWISEDGYATLTGNLENGTPISGTDEICIVP